MPEATLGNKIRKHRLLKRFYKKDLAEYIGVVTYTIDSYELGLSYPLPEKLIKIAEYFKMPIEYFYDDYYEFVFGNYGEQIKNWRKKDGLTYKDAAKIIGIDPKTLSSWERMINYPDRVMYEKLMAVMKKDL